MEELDNAIRLSCDRLEDIRHSYTLYRDIAKRYAGQPDAAARLAKSIRSGSKGQWLPAKGPALPMPPNPTVKPEEAERLARWILNGAH